MRQSQSAGTRRITTAESGSSSEAEFLAWRKGGAGGKYWIGLTGQECSFSYGNTRMKPSAGCRLQPDLVRDPHGSSFLQCRGLEFKSVLTGFDRTSIPVRAACRTLFAFGEAGLGSSLQLIAELQQGLVDSGGDAPFDVVQQIGECADVGRLRVGVRLQVEGFAVLIGPV